MDALGLWNKELVKISRNAIRTLDNIILPNNPVIVFDIDNTLLDSKREIIDPIRVIYYYACMLGITVMIITSRPGTPEVVNWTQNRLMEEGICKVKFYYFRKPENKNCLKFKENARRNIHKRGFNVVMSLGDQDYDISGKYAGIGVKIPIIYGGSVVYASSPLPNEGSRSSSKKQEAPSSAPSRISRLPPTPPRIQNPIHPPYLSPQKKTRDQLDPQDQDPHH